MQADNSCTSKGTHLLFVLSAMYKTDPSVLVAIPANVPNLAEATGPSALPLTYSFPATVPTVGWRVEM